MSAQAALGFDVSLVGASGKTMIYYKDSRDVVVRTCKVKQADADINNRSDCEIDGQENRVPTDAFKRVLLSQLQFHLDFSKEDEVVQKLQSLKSSLAFIESFANDPWAGCDHACAEEVTRIKRTINILKSELAKIQSDALKNRPSIEKIAAGVKIMNAAVDHLVDMKISSTDLTKVSSKNSPAYFDLLTQYDASRAECGTDEILNKDINPSALAISERVSVNQKSKISRHPASGDSGILSRINDCQKLPNSIFNFHNKKTGEDVVWNLVAQKRDPQTGEYHSLWRDGHQDEDGNMLLWGDLMDGVSNQQNAEIKCSGDEGVSSGAGISGKIFRLPTKKEFERAEEDGIRSVLPNMRDHWFWTSSPARSHKVKFAWDFSGNDGQLNDNMPSKAISWARCVSN
jgi:hypothetical protein